MLLNLEGGIDLPRDVTAVDAAKNPLEPTANRLRASIDTPHICAPANHSTIIGDKAPEKRQRGMEKELKCLHTMSIPCPSSPS